MVDLLYTWFTPTLINSHHYLCSSLSQMQPEMLSIIYYNHAMQLYFEQARFTIYTHGHCQGQQFSCFCMFSRRPSGIPEQDVCSVLVPYHQGQEEYVRRELRKLQKENAALAQRVQSGRDAIAHTEQRIAAAVDEWKVTELGKEKKISQYLCVLYASSIISGYRSWL